MFKRGLWIERWSLYWENTQLQRNQTSPILLGLSDCWVTYYICMESLNTKKGSRQNGSSRILQWPLGLMRCHYQQTAHTTKNVRTIGCWTALSKAAARYKLVKKNKKKTPCLPDCMKSVLGGVMTESTQLYTSLVIEPWLPALFQPFQQTHR